MCNLKYLKKPSLWYVMINLFWYMYFYLYILHMIFKCLNRVVLLFKWSLRPIGPLVINSTCIIISMHWILTILSHYTHLPIVLLQKHLLYPQGFCIRSGNIYYSLSCLLVLIGFLSYCTSHGWLSILCLLHRSKSFVIIVYILFDLIFSIIIWINDMVTKIYLQSYWLIVANKKF